MRLAAYAGASTVLAVGIVLRAFHERPNFYSATVYLAQSSACRMILLNLLLLTTYGVMRALQKLLYGPLRAIEREQLWDKAWYAVTETALAMTTFRDEVGAWFFVMFVSLLAGKVWSWLSEARVEALEQQPPANPRLFHFRLIISLAISGIFDFIMLRYCVQTVLEQPLLQLLEQPSPEYRRPGMMVMFAFEFAILAIMSTSTTMKYVLALQEKLIIRKQTKARIEERRQEIRFARDEAERQREGAQESEPSTTLEEPAEEEIDENEIDVPGWQEKGRWVLFLDLLTDFLKLLVYMCFFVILLIRYGIPIHIIRDVFLTTRSFLKRIADFLKYRNATRDMNARYPDATLEELERDGTCIICREEMRPWQPPAGPGADGAANRQASRMIVDERQRPKKLPCGHILHFGCLRSWLERQQVCPTCRSSVLAPNVNRAPTNRPIGNQDVGLQGQQPGDAQAHGQNLPAARPNVRRARTFNIGPWRIAFAAGDERQVREALQALREDNQAAANHGQLNAALAGQQGPLNTTQVYQGANITDSVQQVMHGTSSLQEQIARIEEQFARDINNLALAEQQLTVVRGLQQELRRLRPSNNLLPQVEQIDTSITRGEFGRIPQTQMLPIFPPQMHFSGPGGIPSAEQQVFSANRQQTELGPGHPDLPAGFALPIGWTLLPLQQNAVEEVRETGQHPFGGQIEQVLPQLPFNSTNDGSSSHMNGAPQHFRRDIDVSETTADSGIPSNLIEQTNSQSTTSEASHPQFQTTSSSQSFIPGSEEEAQRDQDPTLDIPNWGNSDQPSSSNAADELLEVQGPSQDATLSHSNGTIVDSKGKAKAVTVEDVEDEDER